MLNLFIFSGRIPYFKLITLILIKKKQILNVFVLSIDFGETGKILFYQRFSNLYFTQ